MKSLKKYITEYKAQDINKVLMLNDRIITPSISLEDLQNAGWGGSFMDDRSWIVIDNVEFNKIKEDGWQGLSTQKSTIGGTISSEKLFELIQKNKSYKGYKGEIFLNKSHNVKL